MNITVQQGEIQKRADAAVVVNLFEGAKPAGATAAMDTALGGLISTVLKGGDFSGKKNEIIVLYTQTRGLPPRVMLVGLGKRKALTVEGVRQAAGTAARKLQSSELSVPAPSFTAPVVVDLKSMTRLKLSPRGPCWPVTVSMNTPQRMTNAPESS